MSSSDNSEGYRNPGFSDEQDCEQTTPSSYPKVFKEDRQTEINIVEANKVPGDYADTRNIMKNVVIVSFGFLLLFTSFNCVSNLQSSINTEDGLGPYSMAMIYGSLIVSCMIIPSFMIQKLTVKWAMVVAMMGYTTYIAAQFHPTFFTMIPASILLGTCAAPLWIAKCSYLTRIGNMYAFATMDEPANIIVRFFGIFFLAFQSSQIWGNLLSSTILASDANKNAKFDIDKCGANFCPLDASQRDNSSDSNFGKNNVPDTKIYLLAGSCLAIAVLAIVVVSVLLDSLSRFARSSQLVPEVTMQSGKQLLTATIAQINNWKQLLIIPLTIWSGMEQGFFASDFTQAYITCSWGVHHVGHVFICYGITDALMSLIFSPIICYVGRVPVFLMGALINGALIVTLFLWRPHPNHAYVFYLIAGLWGAADAIWQTLYGTIFPSNEEAAFSNYRLWESFGFIIAYLNTNILCIKLKLYVLMATLITGMVGYLIIELRLSRNKKKSSCTSMANNAKSAKS